MSAPAGWVSHRAAATLLDPDRPELPYGLPWSVDLCWSRSWPYAVTLSFPSRGGGVEWVVSRDVLAAGLGGPAGLGDVAILPDFRDGGRVELILSSPSGRVGFRVRREVLAGFLTATAGHGDVEGFAAGLDEWLREVAS